MKTINIFLWRYCEFNNIFVDLFWKWHLDNKSIVNVVVIKFIYDF